MTSVSRTLTSLADEMVKAGGSTGPLTRPADGAVLRYGTVTAIQAGTGKVRTDVTGTSAWVPCDFGYVPTVNDPVWLIQQGPIVHVAGKIGKGTAPYTGPSDTGWLDYTTFGAGANWTINTDSIIRAVGPFAEMRLTAHRTGAPSTASATGNIIDEIVASIPSTLRPSVKTPTTPFSIGSTSGFGFLTTGGNLYISTMIPNMVMATGDDLTVTFLYLLG